MQIRDLLNRLKWHPDYDFGKVIVWYISRGEVNNMGCIRGEEIISIGGNFLETSRGFIPYHRIVKIEYGGKRIY